MSETTRPTIVALDSPSTPNSVVLVCRACGWSSKIVEAGSARVVELRREHVCGAEAGRG